MAFTYNYRAGRAKILARAFRIVGAIGATQVLSSAKTNQGSQILNDLIQSWAGDLTLLWHLTEGDINTVIGQATIDLSAESPPILDIEQMMVEDSNFEIPVEIISWPRYKEIKDKAATGRPTHAALIPGVTPTLKLYPTPDAVYTLNYLAATKPPDYDSTGADEDYVPLFERALAYGVAEDLADEYGKSETEKSRIERKAAQALARAKLQINNRIKADNFVESLFRD